MIIAHSKLKIYFGDERDGILKSRDCNPSQIPLAQHEKFSPLAIHVGATQLALLNQTHSAQGMVVADQIPAFDHDGDFLVTASAGVGLGVLTADCLPMVVYDQKNHAVAVIHAGWRGSAQRIVQQTVQSMHTHFASAIPDLKFFFGPSAKKCCYHVAADFKQNFSTVSYVDALFDSRKNQLYFDLPLFNILQLQELGVCKQAIMVDNNFCTLCDFRFFSHRRQGEAAGRQITLASLG